MAPNHSAKSAVKDYASLSHKLQLIVNGKNVTAPGQYFPRAEAQKEPQLILVGGDKSKTYCVVALDLDAPFPSLPVLGPIMHWAHHGFKPSEDGTLITNETFIVDYIGPAPPPLSSPHRYVFFVYEQPADFEPHKHAFAEPGVTPPVTKRMFANLDKLEKDAKLGKIIACNWFTSN